MEKHGLYLPTIFNYQQFNNVHNIPFEKIEENQTFVPLDFFRKIYKENHQLFIKITTEFVLRGGYFNLLNKSPLFPEIKLTNNKLILSTEITPKNAYKDLDYDLLNIGGFTRFFDVMNNKFFNHVPLEGFKVLKLSKNDLIILESNLKAAGFTIYESNDDLLKFKSKSKDVRPVASITVKEKNLPQLAIKAKEAEKTNSVKENELQKIYNLIENNLYYEYIEIKHLKNTDTQNYFKKNGIIFVSDITEEKMKPILNGLSVNQLVKTLEELNDILLNYELIATILLKYVKCNPEISQLKLIQLLDESADGILLRNAMELGIYTFGAFNMDNAVGLFKSRGIGKQKISNFLNKTMDYKTHIKFIPSESTSPAIVNSTKDLKIRKNSAKTKIIDDLFITISGSTFYQNLHISELDIPTSLMNQLFNENIVYLNDFINLDTKNFLYDRLVEKEIKAISKALDKIAMNYGLIADKLVKFIQNNNHISNFYLKDILDNSTYQIVIRNANHCGVKKLGDFTFENSIEFFKTKGIGKKKLLSLLEIIFELGEVKFSKRFDLLQSDNNEAKFLAYFMLEDQVSKTYVIKNQISLVSYTELKQLTFRLAKSKQQREKILHSVEAKKDEIEAFNTEKINNIESYKLSIEEILDFLNLDFILHDLSEDSEILTLPINNLLKNDIKISKHSIEIILFYIEKIRFFEKFDEYLENNLLNLNERELIIFNERMTHKDPKTLEDIANTLGVTRERIRQIESKIKTKFSKVFSTNYIGLYKKHLKKNKIAIIEESGLRNLLVSIQHPEFYYDSKFDLFILSEYEDLYKKTINEVDKLFRENEVLKIKDIDSFINDFNNESNNNDLNKGIEKIFHYYLEKSNYIRRNDVILKENISKNKMYTYIIERFYSKDILDLSDDKSYQLFLERLRLYAPEKIIEDLSGRQKDAVIRNIEAILERENETVLKVDAHMYRKLDVNQIPYALIDEIYNFINSEILHNTFVSVKKIYRTFKSEIDDLGYTDRSIYYLIKFLFEEEFKFVGKTALRIYEKDAEVLSTVEIILTTLDKNNGSMHIDDLIEEIGVEDHSIYQNSSQDTYTLKNGIVTITNTNKTKISENTLNSIKNAVNSRLLNKGYVSIKQVYQELQFNLEVNQELRAKNYTDQIDFTHLLKKMFPDTIGHTRILFNKDSKMDYFDVFIKEVGEMDKYHRKDFIKAGKSLGLSEQTSNNYLNEFIENGKIAPINADFFVLPATLDITGEALEVIEAFILERFEQNEYLSLSTIQSEFSQLSRVNGHRWTIELMNYIATNYLDYKKVYIKNIQYFVDPMIIALRDSQLTYKDIVTIEMKKFKENRTNENVLNYLILKGLLKSNTQHLHAWLFTKGIFVRNDFGRIYLAEEV